MGADSWDICPRCLAEAEVEKEAMVTAAKEAYGKLPPEEYLALRTKAEAPMDLEETLREDYELGIASGEGNMERGTFYVEYKARCTTAGCGFKHDYTYEAAVELEG